MQIQRNLQLRIEEQGRYLQKMFEMQCKSGGELLKATTSNLNDPSELTQSGSEPHENLENEQPLADKKTTAEENS